MRYWPGRHWRLPVAPGPPPRNARRLVVDDLGIKQRVDGGQRFKEAAHSGPRWTETYPLAVLQSTGFGVPLDGSIDNGNEMVGAYCANGVRRNKKTSAGVDRVVICPCQRRPDLLLCMLASFFTLIFNIKTPGRNIGLATKTSVGNIMRTLFIKHF